MCCSPSKLVEEMFSLSKVIKKCGNFHLTEDEKAKIFSDAIANSIPKRGNLPCVTYRLAGDCYILVEYGEMVLDLNLTLRIYRLDHELKQRDLDGLLETAPGVRSLLIKYDPLCLSLDILMSELENIEFSLSEQGESEVRSRLVYLPIAYHDKWNREAIAKYMKSVRESAPYLPDNMEFVAKCNGLEGPEEVIHFHTSTQHMVLGLGDVYLGAPCAVSLNPLYRLVVPKYNPARLWTPEGSVGIGGAYNCIYPMESPGGYQLIGRTIAIWNTYQSTPAFEEAPWLLRPFDRIQFLPVSENELEAIREAFLGEAGYSLRIEEGVFDIKEYNEFTASIDEKVRSYKQQQMEASLRWTVGY